MSIRQPISKQTKDLILTRQDNKCATIPDFQCPLYAHSGSGLFSINNYEIDYIIEWCIAQTNCLHNLQALCPICHTEKTKRFIARGKQFIENEKYGPLSSRIYMNVDYYY